MDDTHLNILKDIRKELQLTNELKSVWLRWYLDELLMPNPLLHAARKTEFDLIMKRYGKDQDGKK